MLKVGDIIQKQYKVIDEIGKGGMATVYLVSDLKLDKYWALKEIHLPKVTDEDVKKRLESPTKSGMTEESVRRELKIEADIKLKSALEEVNMIKSLNYSSIPRITGVFKTPDAYLIIMDFVEGISLRAYLDEVKYIPEKDIIRFAISLCKTLRYLHTRKDPIIYRDMKPQNVMVNNEGELKLLDFGAAIALTPNFNYREHSLFVTQGFGAPEQYDTKRGIAYDQRSDIYGLGKTLYHLATGWSPAKRDKKGNLIPLKRVREWDGTRSSGLQTIIEKAIQDNPEDRYQTVDEMLYDLKHINELSEEFQNKMVRRSNIIMLLGVSLIGGLALGGVGLVNNHFQAENRYQSYLQAGQDSQNPDDLMKAISYKPTEIQPYLDLVDLYKKDGTFTTSEEASLLSVLQPNLPDLKKSEKYGKLALSLGKLYWFYYSDNGTVKAVPWLEQATKLGSKDNLAKTYLEIGKFQQNIISSINEMSDSGMYKKYWNALNDLESSGVPDEQSKFLLIQSTYDVLETYSKSLKNDGLTYDELNDAFQRRTELLNQSDPKLERYIELKDELQKRTSIIQIKLDNAFGKRGTTQ